MEIDGSKKEEFSKLRIVKNLVLLSMSFLFAFTAFFGLAMLQSTMNKAEGIGVISQAAIFTVQALSSLLISSYALKKLGTKVSLITGMAIYIPHVSANLYPTWIIMISSAMLVGVGATLLWGAHATYINECSKLYCELDKNDNATKLSKGLIMTRSKSTNAEIPPEIGKTNMQSSIEELSAYNLTRKCKILIKKTSQEIIANIVQESGVTCSLKQDKLSINLIENSHYCLENKKETGKYAGSTKTRSAHRDEVSQLSKNANDRRDERYFSQIDGKYFDNVKNQTSVSSIDNINAIFFGFHNLLFSSAQISGNLLTFYALRSDNKATLNNLHNCSCGADYCNTDSDCFSEEIEEAYISCAWSTSHIGLVTIFYGLAAAVSSLLSGYAIKFVGRKCVFVVCQAVSTINLVFMLLWKPGLHQSLLFYLAGSLWGINAGVVASQLKAFYGVLFQGEEETAFSCFSVHFAAGFAVAFAYDEYLCTSIKLYILFVFSCVGLVGYLLTEREYQKRSINRYFAN
ncbi:putative potassium channel regulatory protein unc-93 [Caerostris extrusa]|uniref:Potassium channel regulatory protein unc-93 n=1 Tax=Caerostris extrusa TaxID=172846 RepID=A0AAV4XVX6_CAEEX|nr:putative potassium channel regulatory protein unc-93 [Caerostris extrusa]